MADQQQLIAANVDTVFLVTALDDNFNLAYRLMSSPKARDAFALEKEPDKVKDRYGRLVTLLEEISWDEAKKQVGREVEVLVATGEGKKDAATRRLSGRARDNRPFACHS